MEGKKFSRSDLVKQISDFCTENNVPPSELLKSLDNKPVAGDRSNFSDVAVQSIMQLTSTVASLAKSVNESQTEANYSRMNISREQFEFNRDVDIAEKIVNKHESPSTSFAKRKVCIATEKVLVGDNLVHRERRDNVFDVLTYKMTRLRSDKFNRLTKREQKLGESLQRRIEKGKFSGLNLTKAHHFYWIKALLY